MLWGWANIVCAGCLAAALSPNHADLYGDRHEDAIHFRRYWTVKGRDSSAARRANAMQACRSMTNVVVASALAYFLMYMPTCGIF